MEGPKASGSRKGRKMVMTILHPPLKQIAPAGTDHVLGFATQAHLAGAYDVDGSFGL